MSVDEWRIVANEKVYLAPKGGLVYLVQVLDTPTYKIGYTTCHPNLRVSELQVGCPSRLVLADWAPGTREHEKTVHEIYKAYKLRGEWFHIPDVPWYQILRSIDPMPS